MTLLLLQMTIVLLVALACGRVARKLGQARVIGEILGGILVGPSVFGRFLPHAAQTLFPVSSLGEFGQTALRMRLDLLVSVLLLPLFFALTGMQTRMDLPSGPAIWFWTGVVLLAEMAGKMGGAVLAARRTGQSWQNAMALGALLNTRGLVVLIVLNIAYNAHVFSPTLFTMLVVMRW